VTDTQARPVVPAAAAAPPAGASPAKRSWLAGFKPGFFLAAGWVALISLLALLAPWLPFVGDPADISGCAKDGPSGDHWLGCDGIGRDIFDRIVWGGRVSLLIGGVTVALGLLVGGTLGLISGYYRGKIDALVSSVIDMILAVPALVLLLFVVTVRGQTLSNILLAVAILAIPTVTRIARANTLVFAERDFVTASKVLGAKNRTVIWKEILPNVIPPMLSFSLLAVGIVIVVEGSLSFLGLSVQAPHPTWGKIIQEGRQELDEAPHISLFPSVVMFLTVLSLNYISDALRRRFDVREAGI